MLYTHEARSPLSIRVQTTPNHCGFFLTTMEAESVVDKSKDHAKSLWLFLTTMEAQSPMSITIQTTLNHCVFLNQDVDVK